VPLVEDDERYRLGLESGSARHIIETGSNMFDHRIDDQPPDLLAGAGTLTVAVEQLGRFGASVPPATQTFFP
jgi:hypothetical protein